MNNIEKLVSVITEARESLRRFILGLFKDEKDMQDLSGFLKDDTNLYNPDGTLTDEYESLLEKIAEKVDSGEVEEALIASASSPEEADAIRSIIGFVEERDSLMKDYQRTISEYDDNAAEWVKNKVTENLEGEEKEIKIKKIDDILSSEEDIVE